MAMADAFPGGRLVFDAAGKKAVRLMLKTWIKSANIQDVGAYFSVSDAKAELSRWSAQLAVSSRGYMLGYHDLKDPSVSGFFRFLARLGDGMMKMQTILYFKTLLCKFLYAFPLYLNLVLNLRAKNTGHFVFDILLCFFSALI